MEDGKREVERPEARSCEESENKRTDRGRDESRDPLSAVKNNTRSRQQGTMSRSYL